MKAIVTVVGLDKPGIIAAVSGALAEKNVNIEDISQTIMQGNFTMMMLCDLEKSTMNIGRLSALLNELGKKTGVSVQVQNEDIFDAMHRI